MPFEKGNNANPYGRRGKPGKAQVQTSREDIHIVRLKNVTDQVTVNVRMGKKVVTIRIVPPGVR